MSLPHIFLPDDVKVGLDIEAQLEKMQMMREHHAWLRHFQQQIQSIDANLELVKATENSTEPALTPGYWHIKKNNPGGMMPAYFPIEGTNGEFREPDSAFLEEFRSWDMRNPEWMERRVAALNAAKKDKQRAADERLEKMAEIIDHHENTHVSFMDRKKK